MNSTRRRLPAIFSIMSLPLLVLLPACEEVVDEFIEQEAGCTSEQLGDLHEPALPHCSRAIACCKFLKGECGNIQLFTPPESVVQVCNANEAVLSGALEQYREIDEGKCPASLQPESCQDGADQTRDNFVQIVDQGTETLADSSPSCKTLVEQTINRLNEELGEQARLLPAACEPM